MKIRFFEGRISPEKLEHLFERYTDIDVKEATYFICGPSEMIKGIADYLKKDKKVPAIQVLFEYFTAPDEENTEEMSDEFKAIANIESMVTVIIDDDEYSFHLNSKKESILDKALKDNLPVPFACKGGVCCTCKAEVFGRRSLHGKKLCAYRRRSSPRLRSYLPVSPDNQRGDA